MARALQNAIRAAATVDRSLARQLGLTAIDARAVTCVFERHGVGPAALASSLGITTAAVTAVIDRLCISEHLRRDEHPTDRRRVQLFLTYPTVRRMLRARLVRVRQADAAADELSASERRAVIRYLNTVAMIWRRPQSQ